MLFTMKKTTLRIAAIIFQLNSRVSLAITLQENNALIEYLDADFVKGMLGYHLKLEYER